MEIHVSNLSFQCKKCKEKLISKEDLEKHEQIHEKSTQKVHCGKCEKVYRDMNELRRHDWRSHRMVTCNICGDELESRQKIKEHREARH